MPGAPATINAGGLQTCLFYNLDIKHNAAGDVTMGGLQDNGQVRTTGNPPDIVWNDTKGGDGWDIAFDGVTTTRAYHTGGFYGGAVLHARLPVDGQRRDLADRRHTPLVQRGLLHRSGEHGPDGGRRRLRQ